MAMCNISPAWRRDRHSVVPKVYEQVDVLPIVETVLVWGDFESALALLYFKALLCMTIAALGELLLQLTRWNVVTNNNFSLAFHSRLTPRH